MEFGKTVGPRPTAHGLHVFTRSNKNTLSGPKKKIGIQAMSIDQLLGPPGLEARVAGIEAPN